MTVRRLAFIAWTAGVVIAVALYAAGYTAGNFPVCLAALAVAVADITATSALHRTAPARNARVR